MATKRKFPGGDEISPPEKRGQGPTSSSVAFSKQPTASSAFDEALLLLEESTDLFTAEDGIPLGGGEILNTDDIELSTAVGEGEKKQKLKEKEGTETAAADKEKTTGEAVEASHQKEGAGDEGEAAAETTSASAAAVRMNLEDEQTRLKMRLLLAHFSSEQLERYETMRRASLPKSIIRRLIQQHAGVSANQNVVIAMAGMVKIFVGELVEEALDILDFEKEAFSASRITQNKKELEDGENEKDKGNQGIEDEAPGESDQTQERDNTNDERGNGEGEENEEESAVVVPSTSSARSVPPSASLTPRHLHLALERLYQRGALFPARPRRCKFISGERI